MQFKEFDWLSDHGIFVKYSTAVLYSDWQQFSKVSWYSNLIPRVSHLETLGTSLLAYN